MTQSKKRHTHNGRTPERNNREERVGEDKTAVDKVSTSPDKIPGHLGRTFREAGQILALQFSTDHHLKAIKWLASKKNRRESLL